MNWDYKFRDLFGQRGGVHADILIVPHATNIIIVPGKAPEVTSKVPEFNDDGEYDKDGTTTKKATVKKENGEVVYKDVDYVITNEDIVKEKFEYVNSIDTGDNLSFCACESAMIKFTIRNEKEYIPNEDQPDDPANNKYYGVWKPVIPDLQKLQMYDEVVTSEGKKKMLLVGECEGHAIIKAYVYFNGDSSTIIPLGMFVVEEDKVSSSGYEREITAYDFMLTLRDMDCIEWYKRIFDGYDPTKNESGDEDKVKLDPLAYKKGDKTTHPKDGTGVYTIGEALTNFVEELSYLTGTRTVTDKNNFKTDLPMPDYPGPGMPIILDDDLSNKNATYEIPGKKTINGVQMDVERYGYLTVWDLEFYRDDKLIKQDSLSFGKFLEDVGALCGRYPFIRHDYFIDGDYDIANNKATVYERCVLSFKPLPKNDVTILDENTLDNTEIVKGFQHDYYEVESIYVVNVWSYKDKEKSMVSYANLTKKQQAERENLVKIKSDLKSLNITNNVFTAYLDKENDAHKDILNQLFGTTSRKAKGGLFLEAYKNMKYRTYTPCELSTFADLCRDPGDRLQIYYRDMITGEYFECQTYILEMKVSGIQNMQATYTARGDQSNTNFSDYKTGTKYSAQSTSLQTWIDSGSGSSGGDSSEGGDGGGVTITGLSTKDFVEIIRNIGFRLLDEPTSVSAEYNPVSKSTTTRWRAVAGEEADDVELITQIVDGDTTNPITIIDYIYGETDDPVSFTVEPYDIVNRTGDGMTSELTAYIYGTDGKWHDTQFYSYYTYIADEEYGDTILTEIVNFDTTNQITVIQNGQEVTLTAQLGDQINYYRQEEGEGYYSSASYAYVYPGVWLHDFSNKIFYHLDNVSGEWDNIVTIPGGVNIKWTDPEDITNNKPCPAEWDGTVVVRRENRAPLHRWDGTLVINEKTRNAHITEPVVDSDVEPNHTYYYGIFPYDKKGDYRFTKVIRVNTDVSETNPEIIDISLGSTGTWDGSQKELMYVGQHNKLTVMVSNGDIIFKLYSDSTIIYTFMAYLGSSTTDINKIYVSFIEDEEKELAKPSFIYVGNDGYYYNQEVLTDSEMEDVYEWLHPNS